MTTPANYAKYPLNSRDLTPMSTSVKPPKYPPHLFTLEWHLSSPSSVLPVLHFYYPDESIARGVLQAAISNMNRSNGSIERIRLWHRNTLLATVSPNAGPSPKPLPPRDLNGIRHLAAKSRQITRSPTPTPTDITGYEI